MSSLDLTKFLPPRYRDKTIDTLLKSAFNRHLSKEDSVQLFGYVGDRNNLLSNDVKITERDMERQLNQLSPLIRVQHGTEKKVFSWQDLVQKLQLLGVSYSSIGEWFKTGSYNFAPPIDLDKFCNFNQYFWVGPWAISGASLNSLGICNQSYTNEKFLASGNPLYHQEYYVIQRGELDTNGAPIQIQPQFNTPWSAWSYVNLWVHRDDAIAYAEANPLYSINDLPQAIRPIIEYDRLVKLNLFQQDGVPSDSGDFKPIKKYRHNQPPLFDLYSNNGTQDGAHAGVASSIFYYKESPDAQLDKTMNRRLATKNGDFIFGQSLVQEDGSLLFYKVYDAIDQ